MKINQISIPDGTQINLVNGNYNVTIRPAKTFVSRAQFEGFLKRETRLLNDADEAIVREQYRAVIHKLI